MRKVASLLRNPHILNLAAPLEIGLRLISGNSCYDHFRKDIICNCTFAIFQSLDSIFPLYKDLVFLYLTRSPFLSLQDDAECSCLTLIFHKHCHFNSFSFYSFRYFFKKVDCFWQHLHCSFNPQVCEKLDQISQVQKTLVLPIPCWFRFLGNKKALPVAVHSTSWWILC